MMGDQDIINGIHQGNNAAFKHMFDLYYLAITFTVRKLLRNFDEPGDDYASYAFEQLFQHRQKIQTVAHARAFLFFTATNKCRNFIRNKMKSIEAHAEYSHMSDHSYDPLSPGFDKQQAFIAIEKGMEDLPTQARQVAELFYFHRESIGHIAQKLQVKPKSVRQTNSRALQQLRRTVKTADF